MSTLISRRTFTLAALAAAVTVSVGERGAAAADDPVLAHIQGLGNEAVAVLRDKADSTLDERVAAFRDVMERGFDIPLVSRFVLGRHWRAATKEQRAEYLAIFVEFIARVYASRFDSYGGEQFVARSVINDESGDKIVRTEIVRPGGGKPVGVDFRVRQRDEEYRVIDVIVEGISMLHTHRVEFGSVVNRKGIDGLLKDLRARIEAPVETGAE